MRGTNSITVTPLLHHLTTIDVEGLRSHTVEKNDLITIDDLRCCSFSRKSERYNLVALFG